MEFGIGGGSHLETYKFQIAFVTLISSSICILVTKNLRLPLNYSKFCSYPEMCKHLQNLTYSTWFRVEL